jgi:voltage-gated potassium channel
VPVRAPDPGLRLPRRQVAGGPLRSILLRFGLAVLIVVINWGLVLLDRSGYTDSQDGVVSTLDALYYTTVSLTTTGYGDITPVTPRTRLLNTLVVTPMRLLFVIILVGTTIQALTERSRTEFRIARWRARMHRHVVVAGYGTKGRNALRALRLRGHPQDQLVVVERSAQVAAEAARDGYAVVSGDATRAETLREARAQHARVVVVALGRDDAAILTTLTLRRLAPHVTVVAAARESENAELLEQSGARSVVVSSETTGRLLGLATDVPEAVSVVEDLLSFGHGLDLAERRVEPEEVGRSPGELPVPVVAVVREGRVLRYTDPDVASLRQDDVLLHIAVAEDAHPPGDAC